jgi:hypothetical protein
MSDDTYSDTVLFHECVNVLKDCRRPIHYGELTDKAVERINQIYGNRIGSQYNRKRQIEDVRERLLAARRYGTFYIGKPYCIACLQSWFKTSVKNNQLSLMPNIETYTFIPTTIESSINGCFEALMRNEYMVNKGNAPLDKRYLARAKGLQIESAVFGYMKTNYPDFIDYPDNYKIYQKPCDHDFKLIVNGETYLVDVAGSNSKGNFDNNCNKTPVDLHILCEIIENKLYITNIAAKNKFNNKYLVSPYLHNDTKQPDIFFVWLNINKYYADLSYQFFLDAVKYERYKEIPTWLQ